MRIFLSILSCLYSFQAQSVELGSWLIHEILIQEYLAVSSYEKVVGKGHKAEDVHGQALWAYRHAQDLHESVSLVDGNVEASTHDLKWPQEFLDFYWQQRQRPLSLKGLLAVRQPEDPRHIYPWVRAVFDLREKRYAAVLKVLIDLQKNEPQWRVLYDKVQRIYSIQQKGSGRTALNG